MKERPIIFSGEMVRAILDGSKTMTRRIVSFQNSYFDGSHWPQWAKDERWAWKAAHVDRGPSPAGNPGPYLKLPNADHESEWWGTAHRIYPKWWAGDRLWVRETWQHADWTEDGEPYIRYQADGEVLLRRDYPEEYADAVVERWAELSVPENYNIDNRAADRRWRSPIHLPRWASRITLEVTGIGLERVQDISEEDAVAEGVHQSHAGGPWGEEGLLEDFVTLWESIHGPGSWDENRWVWVISFRRVAA